MPNLNRVMLIGHVTRDPEVKYTPNGASIAQVGLAVNHNWTTDSGEKREEVTFVDVEFFGKQAETIGEYVSKGDPLYVEGRLKLDTWDDRTTGQKRTKMKVVGQGFQFLKSREKGEGDGRCAAKGEGEHQPAPPTQGRRALPPRPVQAPDLTEAEDDIPF